MKYLFIILMMLLGSFEAYGQVDLTPTKNSIAARIKGGDTLYINRQSPQVELKFSSTPAGWSLFRAVGVAYSDSNGVWRLAFNICAVATAGTTLVATLEGVTFKDVANFNQPLAVLPTTSVLHRAYADASTGNIEVVYGTSSNGFFVSGDVELDSKPDWVN